MKHLALLAAVYALIAALVLPSSLLASEDADPAASDTPAAETAPAGETPTAPPEPAPVPAEPAPAPEPAAPAPEQPAAAPEQAAAPAPPEQYARERKQKPSAKAAGSGSVTIADFQFTPAQITINQGDTVTWTNNGPTPHSATAPDGSFDTGIFPAAQSRTAHLQRRRDLLLHLHAPPEHARHDRGAGLAERRRHAGLQAPETAAAAAAAERRAASHPAPRPLRATADRRCRAPAETRARCSSSVRSCSCWAWRFTAVPARRSRAPPVASAGSSRVTFPPVSARKIRVVVAKPGLDGHDRGAKIIARALRDAGMEVIYTGLHQTPEQIVETVLQEDADAVGLSILSGAHMTLVPRIASLLKDEGAEDVVLVVGGTIPNDDIEELKELGVAEVFTPGSPVQGIIDTLRRLTHQSTG